MVLPAQSILQPNWPKQHSMPTVCYGNEDHKTRFSVSQVTQADDGEEWRNLTHLIRTIEAHLVLQDFWNMRMYHDYLAKFIDYFDENAAAPGNTSFWNCCESLGCSICKLSVRSSRLQASLYQWFTVMCCECCRQLRSITRWTRSKSEI